MKEDSSIGNGKYDPQSSLFNAAQSFCRRNRISCSVLPLVILISVSAGSAMNRFQCSYSDIKIVKSKSFGSQGLRSTANNTRSDLGDVDLDTPATKVALVPEEKTGDEVYYSPPISPREHENNFEGVWARPFEPWHADKPFPCFKPEPKWKDYKTSQSPTTNGLLFLKPYKTGSSTASGIHLRLAENAARSKNTSYEICKVRYDHVNARSVFPNRERDESFLWTIVRDPTKRLVSQFFHFEVSRGKQEPTDANFIDYVRSGFQEMIKDYYLNAFSTAAWNNPVDAANKILEEYNMVGVTERMEESAVALAMLMGRPIADVLYLKAKGHGGYDDAGGRQQGNICTYIWPGFQTSGMKEFMKSDEFQNVVHWDHVLYQAANRSLDLTIENLGREEFEKNLAKYREANELAKSRCLPKTVFPCSEGGAYTPHDKTDCLWKDSGCGHDCLDEIATELNL